MISIRPIYKRLFDVNDYVIEKNAKGESRCIYSFALGRDHEMLRDIVMPSHLAYAFESHADYFCFTKAGPDLPSDHEGLHQQFSGLTYNKIFYANMLSNYESILYLDLDVLITSNAPVIFDKYKSSDSDITAFNESFLDPVGINKAIEAVVLHYGGHPWSPDYYFNTGVMLLRGSAAERFTVPGGALFSGRWSEQTYINWMVHNLGMSWMELDRRFNTLVSCCDLRTIQSSYFLHFAGQTSPKGLAGTNDYSSRYLIIKSLLEHNPNLAKSRRLVK